MTTENLLVEAKLTEALHELAIIAEVSLNNTPASLKSCKNTYGTAGRDKPVDFVISAVEREIAERERADSAEAKLVALTVENNDLKAKLKAEADSRNRDWCELTGMNSKLKAERDDALDKASMWQRRAYASGYDPAHPTENKQYVEPPQPVAEDAELDARVQKLGNLVRGTGVWFDAVEYAIELLATRVKEMRR